MTVTASAADGVRRSSVPTTPVAEPRHCFGAPQSRAGGSPGGLIPEPEDLCTAVCRKGDYGTAHWDSPGAWQSPGTACPSQE